MPLFAGPGAATAPFSVTKAGGTAGVGTSNPQNLQGTGPEFVASPVINRPPSPGAPYTQYGVTPKEFADQYKPPAPAAPSQADLAGWYGAAAARDAANQEALVQGQMTDAMNQYAGQFQASQASQQQAMNAALMSSMQGLGARRDAAATVAAGMPGQINATYNRVNADTARENKLQGVGGATGIDPGIAALINENHGAERGQALSATPLMQAGITADYSKGDTTLHNTHMANQAQLAAEANAGNLELAKMRLGIAQQNADYQHQKAARGFDLADKEALFSYEQTHGGAAPTEQDKINAMTQEEQARQATGAGFSSYGGMQKVLGESYTNALNSALAGTGDPTNLNGKSGSAKLPGQYDSKGKEITISGNAQTLLQQAYAVRPDVVRALAQMGNPFAKAYLGSKTPSSGNVAA